jgi:hypothetical protein
MTQLDWFQVAVFAVETAVAGAVSLHHVLPDDLHGVQGLPDHGAADGGGEAGQVVQGAVNRYNER